MDNLNRYFEDSRFIQWVFEPNEELEEWWRNFEAGNPGEKQNIQVAHNILLKLHTNDKELPEREKIMLFTRILQQVEKRGESRISRRISTVILKYAAVAVIFFSMGALLFYHKHDFRSQLSLSGIPESIEKEEAVLMRPGGDNIVLNTRDSHIEYRKDGQVVVNNNILEGKPPGRKGAAGMNQLIMPYGKTSRLVLPDGTRVWLNAGSRLVYPEYFADRNREVFLSGEAYFMVESAPNRPFVVNTTDVKVVVTGTQFNVSAYATDEIIETVVTEGKVRLELSNSGFFPETAGLLPGQLASFNKTRHTMSVSEVDTDHYTLWKEGFFKFESTDLSRVTKKLERYFNIRFRYSNPFLGGIKITGKLELGESREEVLANVADVSSVKIIQISEDYYEIK